MKLMFNKLLAALNTTKFRCRELTVRLQVRYAAEHNIPFVARAGGHGATAALGTAEDAIQIDLRALNHVRLSQDGTSASIGGGADVKGVVTALEKLGKRTGMRLDITGSHEKVN